MIPLSVTIATAISFLAIQVYATVYITDHSQRRIIEMRGRAQPCLIHTDGNKVEKMLRGNGPKYLQRMSPNDLDALSSSCSDMEQINKRGGFIYPGTKWCGPGNIASSYSDLGPLTEEDKCCREHDHCPNTLEPGQCRQGVCNVSPFTRSHCDCDNAFKRCLRIVNSEAASTIGNLYFNIVRITCFTDRRTCPQYMRDDSSYTWFCEEWKFEPSGEFNTSLLTRKVSSPNQKLHIPDRPENAKSEDPPPSTIDKNLQNLYETEPNVVKIMESGKSVKENSVPEENTPIKHGSSILNSIADGRFVWRD